MFEGAEAALWTALARQGIGRVDQTGCHVDQTGCRRLDVSSIRPCEGCLSRLSRGTTPLLNRVLECAKTNASESECATLRAAARASASSRAAWARRRAASAWGCRTSTA